jgi:hypothetical protein
MAQLPPIPDRPSDRPETWCEYTARRGVIAMHRQFYDDLTGWLGADCPIAWATRNAMVERFLASGSRDCFMFEAPPVKRRLRVVWSCGAVPGHEHPSCEDAERCISLHSGCLIVGDPIDLGAPPPPLGRFEGLTLPPEEVERLMRTI